MAPGDQRAARRGRKPAALRVVVVDANGRPLTGSGLRRWLVRTAPASARGTITIALAPDTVVRALNREYRHEDYATDVLSFPADSRSSRRRKRRAPATMTDVSLGDIVIATGVAKRQARDAGHRAGTELRILALHGLLHLLGYDHERDHGRMARLERRLRRKGRLREGLIERAGPKTCTIRP